MKSSKVTGVENEILESHIVYPTLYQVLFTNPNFFFGEGGGEISDIPHLTMSIAHLRHQIGAGGGSKCVGIGLIYHEGSPTGVCVLYFLSNQFTFALRGR